MANRFAQFLASHREKLLLFVYFVVISVLSAPIGVMLGTAWERAVVARALLRLHLLVGVSLAALSTLLFGLFIGLLVLMTIDQKKRWQAFLLWISVIVVLAGLSQMGLFLPNLNLVQNVPYLLVGMALGLLVGGVRDLLEGNRQIFEFRRASQGILYLVSVLVVVGFVEYHFSYTNFVRVGEGGIVFFFYKPLTLGINTEGLLFHAAITSIFLVTIRRFVQYEAEEDFFILGPPASGKSLFLIGAFLEAKQFGGNGDTPLRPSRDLMGLIEKLDQSNTDWIVEATGQGEIQDLRFQYVHGSVFPINLLVSTLDYAGEYLPQIPDALTGTLSEDMTDEVLTRLRLGVEEADTLVLVIDVERFVEEDQTLDINPYYDILQATSDKNVLLVATKADYLAEQFRADRGLEPHRYYDEFMEYVNQRLRQSQNVDSLVRESTNNPIIPVYYQTRIADDGRRVPLRDETGAVVTVGFDEVLNQFGR